MYTGFYTDLVVVTIIMLALILSLILIPKRTPRQDKVHNAISGASNSKGTYIPLLHGKSIINKGPDMNIPRIPVVYSKDFSWGNSPKPLYVPRDMYNDDIEIPASLRNQMR